MQSKPHPSSVCIKNLLLIHVSSAKNIKQPEESGPFGRNRSIRYTSTSRRASTRQGTTPSRDKKDNSAADFARLFIKDQAAHSTEPATNAAALENIPTECLLYGYASRNSQWKVISRFERIVQPSIICEDYAREDPNLMYSSSSPITFNRSASVLNRNLSKEALQKSKVYRGGNHWIKVTFDSWEAAQKACYYSPVEIDGCLVYCEEWQGKGPLTDAPIPKGADTVGELVSTTNNRARTLSTATGKASAVAGFEQAFTTLPRSHTLQDIQYRQPGARDDMDINSSTASSATATGPSSANALTVQEGSSALRSRSVPHLPSQSTSDPTSQFMTRTPNVKRVVLRPVSEALPPRQSLVERILRTIPLVSWIVGPAAVPKKTDEKAKGGLIGEGPVLKEDGTWDDTANGWYWGFWYKIDSLLGSDYCGLKED